MIEPENEVFPFSGLSVLIICTRDPRGRLTGRKTVLRTQIDTLTSIGFAVNVAYFGPSEAESAANETGLVRYFPLPHPSVFDRLSSGLGWLLKRQPPLNEGLYRGQKATKALFRIARDTKADLVVTDMLRTANYGKEMGLPWVADLDDLLSRRYRHLAEQYNAQVNLMGYYQSFIHRICTCLGAPMMPWVLKREAAAIERRESEVARSADVTTLVGASEARALSEASGQTVFCAPMAITGPSKLPSLTGRTRELVFLGGTDYGPNLESINRFSSQIQPRLAESGHGDLKLHVIGHSANVPSFSDAVVFEGYVDDLDAEMQRYRAMLVPQVLPGGVKTKIVVAALNGTVVLAHPTAIDGLNVRSGREVLVWNTEQDLAQLIDGLRNNTYDIDTIARQARAWAEREFSQDTLSTIWRGIVARALSRKDNGDH